MIGFFRGPDGAKFCGVRVYDFDGDVGENTKGSIFPKS